MPRLDEKMVDAARVDPEVQERIFASLNRARRPEDLKYLETIDIGKDIANQILEKRGTLGPFGFIHLKDLIGIKGFTKELFDRLQDRFGPANYGEWSIPYETRLPDGSNYRVAHAALLHTGLVLFLPESNTKTTLLWDPSDEINPQFEFLENTPDERLFCSGHSFLSDGKLLVVGGGGGSPSGVNRAWKFDPLDKSWVKTTGDMTHARWYPTVVTLGDERKILVVGGRPSVSTSEIYDELTDKFTVVTGPDAERDFRPLYPGLHLLPGGEVFYSRTGFASGGIGPGGSRDPLDSNAYLRLSGTNTGEWVEIANEMEHTDRVRGMSVLLLDPCDPTVRVMVIGGTNMPGSETAEIVTLSALNPVWAHPTIIPGGKARTNVNAVLLPDNTVFVCGGTTRPDVPCALYKPAIDTWAEMARLNYRKQYHSVSLLLPNGKVMATGGGSNVIEIFSPPYLFKPNGTLASRPGITTAPDAVQYGQSFRVESPQAAITQKVVLVRPIAVTHQTDTEQRVIEMKFTRHGNRLDVTAPDSSHYRGIAPRGYFLLFILDRDGVPSEGEFMLLQ